MKISILIKSHESDFEWLNYCLRSIEKYCTGFNEIILAIPETDNFVWDSVRVVKVKETGNKYLFQQLVKLHADDISPDDMLLVSDSDTLFCRPVTPETYLRDGKPIWLYTRFARARELEGLGVDKWQDAMTRFLGKPSEYEFMRRQGFMVPRWLLQAFRTFCWHRHGCSVEDYVMRQPHFSEWNCLGFYAWTYHKESFHWINTETDQVPELTVKQFWSHAPIDQHRAEMEAILAGTAQVTHVPNAVQKQLGNLTMDLDVPRTDDGPMKALPKSSPKGKKPTVRTPEQRQAMLERMAKVREAKRSKA